MHYTAWIMMKKREKHFIKTWLQIFLLVGASFAFAYILDSSFEGYEGDSYKENNKSQIRNKLLFVLGIAIKLIFSDRNLVSAQEQIEISDLSKGIATCFTGKDGSICQEYPASKCNDRCAETCFDAPRKETSECKLGTCFDPNFGTCQENSPRFECETKDGQWYDDPAGNVPICKKACCVVGEGVKPLITERECAKIGDVRGIKTEFRLSRGRRMAGMWCITRLTSGRARRINPCSAGMPIWTFDTPMCFRSFPGTDDWRSATSTIWPPRRRHPFPS